MRHGHTSTRPWRHDSEADAGALFTAARGGPGAHPGGGPRVHQGAFERPQRLQQQHPRSHRSRPTHRRRRYRRRRRHPEARCGPRGCRHPGTPAWGDVAPTDAAAVHTQSRGSRGGRFTVGSRQSSDSGICPRSPRGARLSTYGSREPAATRLCQAGLRACLPALAAAHRSCLRNGARYCRRRRRLRDGRGGRGPCDGRCGRAGDRVGGAKGGGAGAGRGAGGTD